MGSNANAQESPLPPPLPDPPEQPPLQVPEPVLYRAFFAHVDFLERKATELESRGEDAAELRQYYRTTLDLSPGEALALKRQSAQALDDIRRINGRIRSIIQSERAKYPGGRVPVGESLPQPPPELAQLDQEKEAASLQAAAELRRAIGDEGFEKVDTFLKRRFARNITAVPTSTPEPPSGPLGRKGAQQ